MSNDILRRDKAPIASEAWELIDFEAQRVLRGYLSARAIVDFDGPYDWLKDSVNGGTLDLTQTRPKSHSLLKGDSLASARPIAISTQRA